MTERVVDLLEIVEVETHHGRLGPTGGHGNGLAYREFTGEGAWQDRFIQWMRDLGFFGKPGEETLAAKDVAAFVAAPPAKP